MSLINQDVRFAERGDSNNPTAIYQQYKPVRFLSGSGVPSPALGEDCHHYIDEASSIEYVKRGGVWEPLVNYATIVAPSLPPATVPDNLTADTLDNKNTGDLAINAAAALSLSGGSLDIDATGDILIDSVTDLIVTSATGKVELQGNSLSLQATGTGFPTFFNSAAPGLILLGKNSSSIAMTSDDINMNANAAGRITFNSGLGCEFNSKPLTNVSAINGSDSISTYKNLGVNLSSQLEYLEPADSIQGVVPNVSAVAGRQYIEVGVASSPADFFTISLPNPAGQNRKLVGIAAHFLHNDVAWQINAGSINLVVGYVPVGQAPTVANLVTLWSSPAFATGVAYPTINDPQITTPATLPIGASIVVYALKSAGLNLSALQADISICLKFL